MALRFCPMMLRGVNTEHCHIAGHTEMLTVNADRMIFLLALCFICVSSEDEQDFSCEEYSEICETHTLSAPIGSSVLLPCILPASSNWVSWDHVAQMNVVRLTSQGRMEFVNPRHGRVKVFPNQCSEGNYSIGIDRLKTSDLGCYRCKQEQACCQVELVAQEGTLSGDMLLLIYICVGVAAFILLIVGIYFCTKDALCCDNSTEDNLNNPVVAGARAPPEETGRAPVDGELRGEDNLVYENDNQYPASQQRDPTRNRHTPPGALPDLATAQPTQSTSGLYPNLSQFNFERAESQRTKWRFHTELFSRLRQASHSRHYYVNQSELNKQQAMSTQAEKNRRAGLQQEPLSHLSVASSSDCEYQNPIYNRSAEQLNRL